MKAATSKIERVMVATKCSREVAVSYLIAEEWDVQDAITSLKGDRQYA